MPLPGPSRPYLVIGAGPAAAAATRVLARAGAAVVVLGAEPRPPYDRTVLSTSLLLDPGAEPPPLWQAGEEWLSRVDLRTGTRAVRIDPRARSASTDTGEELPYRGLLLATGARPRRLELPGADGPGVHYLRDLADAVALREHLAAAQRVLVVGGGVIGLEVASAAATLGRRVEVVEAAGRVLGRGVPEPVARWLVGLHEEHGVRIRTGIHPLEVLRADDRVTGVRLSDGSVATADLVVVGVGVSPRDELARAAGLAVADGILVDRSGRTSAPDLFAAGDAVRMRWPGNGSGLRLESYQPAGRQGEVAARVMLGEQDAYLDVPWTWSDQYHAVLQAAGTVVAEADPLLCGDPDGEAVLVLSFWQERLVAACGVAGGPGIARPIRAAQALIGAGGRVQRAALEAARSDLARLTRILREAARSQAG